MPNQREILLAPFPFSDEDAEKQRPVLVISNSVFNAGAEDVIVMAITSNLTTPLPGINIQTSYVEHGKLPRVSRILPAKVYSVAQSRIRKFVCRLAPEPFAAALAMLQKALETPNPGATENPAQD
jgi:mRNA-degrading endonuclease toxin of MazEF toxin-antitoxin module